MRQLYSRPPRHFGHRRPPTLVQLCMPAPNGPSPTRPIPPIDSELAETIADSPAVRVPPRSARGGVPPSPAPKPSAADSALDDTAVDADAGTDGSGVDLEGI